jgi:putative chitinase
MKEISIDQIQKATDASLINASRFAIYINENCKKFNISTPIRQLCFLAQLGHESGNLFYTEEIASGSAYEGRKDLGNIQPGDGVKFKGRGLIQITGRSNYQALSKALGIDLITTPTLLGAKNSSKCTPIQLQNAVLSAGWFWNSRNLNLIADKIDINKNMKDEVDNLNLTYFIRITKRINGGTNGLQDRLNKYRAGVGAFK